MTKLQQLAALCAKVDHLKGIEQSYHTDAVYEAAERIFELEAQVALLNRAAELTAEKIEALEVNAPQAQPDEAAADAALWLFADDYVPCPECSGTGTQIGVRGRLPCVYCLGTGDAS